MAVNQADVAKITLQLAEQGEIERLKEYFRQRLSESGWKEQIEEECRAIVERKPNENITAEQLATEVLASSRDKVPAKLAEELRDRVKMAVDRAVQQAASGGK